MTDTTPLLTTEEVAEQLQVPRRTVLRYVQEGRLKCRKYSQRTFRFSPGDVEEFEVQCRAEAEQAAEKRKLAQLERQARIRELEEKIS